MRTEWVGKRVIHLHLTEDESRRFAGTFDEAWDAVLWYAHDLADTHDCDVFVYDNGGQRVGHLLGPSKARALSEDPRNAPN
jgi:hypothetical protein